MKSLLRNSSIIVRFAAFAALAPLIAACGGGGGGGGGGAGTNTNTPAASVSLTASAATVVANASVTLSWSTTNASSCTASGGWSGSRATSGSELVGPLAQTTDFRLSCSGSGGSGIADVTVQVDDGSGVAVNLLADPVVVAPGGTATLQWSVTNANTCTAGLGWGGAQPTSGSLVTQPLTVTTSFELTCDGPSGSGVGIVTVQVFDKVLRWRAPNLNLDGSPLVDLAGYRVHWGPSSRTYSDLHTINDSTLMEWEVTAAPGTYYFAITAFDSDGNESGFSNEVLKTIP